MISPPAIARVYRRIAFVRQNNDPEIYSIRSSGGGLTNLSNSPKPDIEPRWSPDGSRILFLRREGDGTVDGLQIWVMNADGSNQHNVSNNATWGHDFPAWSPDGTRIAFYASPAGVNCCAGNGVFVMNADGTGKIQVTDQGSEPDWSPDGTRLVVDRDGILRINADGTSPLQLDSNINDAHPLWSPDARGSSSAIGRLPSFPASR